MVVPSGVGAAFEVSEAETCLQFAVVVFDAPPDFGQADEFFQRGRPWQGREPVIGRRWSPGGHSASSHSTGREPSSPRGRSRFAGRTRRAMNRDFIEASVLFGVAFVPRRHVT